MTSNAPFPLALTVCSGSQRLESLNHSLKKVQRAECSLGEGIVEFMWAFYEEILPYHNVLVESTVYPKSLMSLSPLNIWKLDQ